MGHRKPRTDRDTLSIRSVNPTVDDARRLEERDIKINWWGGRIKETFEKLDVGDVTEKDTEDRRVRWN